MKPIRAATNPVTLSVRQSRTTRSLSVGQLLPKDWMLVQCYMERVDDDTVRIVVRNVPTPNHDTPTC